ncbi:MAG: hypothetical protein KBS75_09660, partial [Bacteroidales bacterium]|nr:hypothetical protein [Candidatus Equimonas faecalis]
SLREDDMAARLEGCTVELELNNIRDMNGNYAEPVKWQAYVRRNQLVWEDSFFDMEKKSGYSESFFATIRNEGGTYESWTLSNCPEWLVPDRTSGTLEPQHTQQITFRIPESTPVGHYEGTVVLTGSRGIGERLYVTLNSLGNVPDWKVNPKDYECSMNIIGQLRQDDVISSDTQDIVAAFVGNECRGVASPRYFSRDDAYYVMLTVYGNAPATGENPEQLTYKVYDASTGAIHPVVNLQPSDAAPSFRPDGIAGSMDEPVVFCPTDTYGQDIQLNKGWTWVSFFIDPLSTAVDRSFASNKDKIQIVKDANSTYTPSIAMGDLTTVSLASMYKVKATEPLSDMLSGPLAQTEKVEITVGARIWSWIGYPCFLANSVDAALANLNPEEGDIIKSQSAFSTYTGGTWFGTLEALQPGQGYLYYSQAAAGKTFHLATPASRAQAPSTRNEAGLYAPFENTMNIMAQATSNGQPA